MKLLYSQEHFDCPHYSWHDPLIKIVSLKDEVYEFEANRSYLVVVYKGSITYSSGMIQNKEMHEGDMFTIPFLNPSVIRAKGNCRLFFFKLSLDLSFCEHLSIEKLYDYLDIEEDTIHPQKTNEILDSYLKTLEVFMDDGLKCIYFLEIKIKELLFILKAYYTKESLARLFYVMLTRDSEFTKQVFQNVKKVKTAKELAESMFYSVSGFEKRFKKVFGISANKWMQQNLARQIYHEINCSNKTMNEIAHQFGFSPSYFNDYCKRVFKVTPNQLKKRSET